GVDVVREEHAARAQVRPGLAELEPHAVERVLAVVHERVDRPETLEQRRQLVLGAAEDEGPPLLPLRRDPAPRLPSRRGPSRALAFEERARLVIPPDLARQVYGVQVPLAVVVEGE